MLNLILLQAETAADPAQGNQWSFWIMMVLIFVVFYFFMIRPQTKRQKELQRAKYKYNQSNWFMKLFRKKGYKALEAQPVDLFPFTEHVETVVLMSRKDT